MNAYLQKIWSNRNYRIALLILLIFMVWQASGLLSSEAEKEAATEEPVRSISAVKARYVDAQDYVPVIKVRARTEADRRVELRAETAGRLVSSPVAEGQLVKKGDLLCELAMDDRELRVIEARSAVAQAQLEFDASQKLRLSGHQSQTALASAKARLDAAKANLGSRELDMANTRIRAPFDGVVERLDLKVGSFMERGGLCAVLLDLDPILFSGQVSESEIGRLREGGQATARLLDGREVPATLRFLGREAGNATRTFRVEAAGANPQYEMRSGLTIELLLPLQKQRAHSIPSSLLALDDEGKVGVRILDEQKRVEFRHLQLLGDSADGVWVLGLPERTLLITVGQEYVSIGSTVEVSLQDGTASANALPGGQ
jgi:multidrug efflux system membrane fusion protein